MTQFSVLGEPSFYVLTFGPAVLNIWSHPWYLILDNKLSFDHRVTDIHRRCQQRLRVIRKLRFFSVKPYFLLLLYRSIIGSSILYCTTCYFTMLSCTNRNKLYRITNASSYIICTDSVYLYLVEICVYYLCVYCVLQLGYSLWKQVYSFWGQ